LLTETGSSSGTLKKPGGSTYENSSDLKSRNNIIVQGEVIDSPAPTKEMMFIRKPIGVAALITPVRYECIVLNHTYQ
jgi:acyl-CoA reductase-like NAD-dependent aldehyde dehydrogenase